MLDITTDIHSLTDFKRNTLKFLKQINKTRQPLVLTVNGKAALVVLDAAAYQALVNAAARRERDAAAPSQTGARAGAVVRRDEPAQEDASGDDDGSFPGFRGQIGDGLAEVDVD